MNVADSVASGIIIVYRKELRYYAKLGRCFKKVNKPRGYVVTPAN